MGFGLFGKLPQKRDFVSTSLPNSILNPFFLPALSEFSCPTGL